MIKSGGPFGHRLAVIGMCHDKKLTVCTQENRTQITKVGLYNYNPCHKATRMGKKKTTWYSQSEPLAGKSTVEEKRRKLQFLFFVNLCSRLGLLQR